MSDTGPTVPYKSGGISFGAFAMADGAVHTLRDDIKMETLRNLLQQNDGNPVGEFGRNRARGGRGAKRMQAVEIFRVAGKISARLVSDSRDD